MKKNYFIQINEEVRSIMLQPCSAFEAIRLLNFYRDGISPSSTSGFLAASSSVVGMALSSASV